MASAASARRGPSARWQRWIHHVWIVPILLVAFWLRIATLGDEHLYGDEAEYSIVARYLSRDPTFLAYPAIEGFGPTPFVSQPPLVLYVMALSMKIFGATDFAALLPVILFGVATVGAVYAIGHRLGGRFVGLAGAALLAVMPFHIKWSRHAMLDVPYAFFLTLTAYFLIAWIQDRSRRAALGVGIATACACLAKLPGVLAGPVVLLVFLGILGATLFTKGQDARGTGKTVGVGETLLQGGLGAAPVLVGGALYVGLLWYLDAIGNLWLKLQWQLGRVDSSQARIQEVTAVHRDWAYYFDNPKFSFAAQMGTLVVTLALIGLGVALLRFARSPIRRAEHAVVPLMALVLLAFFQYSDRKEGFYLLPFAPLAAVMVAEAGDGLRAMLAWANLKLVPGTFSKRLAPVAVAVGIILVTLPTYSAANKSYDDYALGDNQDKYFGYGTREAAQWIHERDPDAAQYGTLLGRFTIHWYNEQPAFHWYVDHTYLESQIQSGHLKYIVYDDYLGLAFDRDYMRELINKYNGEAVQTFRAGWGQVTVYELHP